MFRIIFILSLVVGTFSLCFANEVNVSSKKNEQNSTNLRSKDIIRLNKKIERENKKLELKQKQVEILEKRLKQKESKLEKLNTKYVKGENE